MNSEFETKINTIVESDDSFLYVADEPDGELTYHLQINNVTIHFFTEEWQKTLLFLKKVINAFNDETE